MSAPASETAMVLSGGGAYGAFAVGIMKALFAGRSPATVYTPLAADIFTGTSVGAFNAAMMVAHGREDLLSAANALENVWLNLVADRPGRCGNGIFRVRGNLAEFIDASCLAQPATMVSRIADDSVALSRYVLERAANFLLSSAPLEERAMALVNVGSFVDSAPYAEMLNTVIHEDAIRDSPKHLRIVSTNWVTGEARSFNNSDFLDGRGIRSIMASTSIPGVFPPERIDEDLYVDGGVVENTPLGPAIDVGATNLHVVYLDPNPGVVRLRGEPYTVDTMLRVYLIMLATKLSEDIETARWINAGLDAIAAYREDQAASDSAIRDFIRVAGQFLKAGKSYKRLTIHRYFPEKALGNDLGMLNFGIDPIARMITEGERVALLHDCAESNCVI
ncbi:MAG TPA: patatin-like phospholipase family protein [Candidatus Angelobacter sp.]